MPHLTSDPSLGRTSQRPSRTQLKMEQTQIMEGEQRSKDLQPRPQTLAPEGNSKRIQTRARHPPSWASKSLFEFHGRGRGSTHCPGADSQSSVPGVEIGGCTGSFPYLETGTPAWADVGGWSEPNGGASWAKDP